MVHPPFIKPENPFNVLSLRGHARAISSVLRSGLEGKIPKLEMGLQSWYGYLPNIGYMISPLAPIVLALQEDISSICPEKGIQTKTGHFLV